MKVVRGEVGEGSAIVLVLSDWSTGVEYIWDLC